jgi:putative SOS response-associated peptidase YedK
VCGRFNQIASGEEVAEAFGLDAAPALEPRYNVAPTQKVPVVGVDPTTGRRGLARLTWGLVPRGAVARERGFINARGESAWERPAFAQAFAERRCLIPATGFYEWQKLDGKRRQPWLVRPTGGGLFAFAGLWEPASKAEDASPTFTILTTEPNDLTRPIHDRMPVILAPGDYARWLDPGIQLASEVRPLLKPYPSEQLTAYPVSPRVNSPANDDPGCLEPLSPGPGAWPPP